MSEARDGSGAGTRLRAAEQNLRKAEEARKRGNNELAVLENRKACRKAVECMQMLGSRAYVLLQRRRKGLDLAAARELKMLDSVGLRAEGFLGSSLRELEAASSRSDLEKWLTELHLAYPGNRILHEYLVNISMKEKRWDAVIAESERLLLSHPSSRSGHLARATALEEKGRMSEAISSCQRALELESRDSVTLARVYRLCLLQGKRNEWIEYIGRMARRHPDNSVIQDFVRRQ